MPWQWPFWRHLCGNLGRGLGYDCNIAVVAGALALLVFIGLALGQRFASTKHRETSDARLLVSAYAAAVLASVAVTAMARAGFGLPSACASRYTEPVLLLVPFAWLIVHTSVQARGKRLVMAAGLLLPYANDMNFKKIYAREHDIRTAATACIRDFYRANGSADCPMTYPANLASRLERARAMQVVFATQR